MILKQHICDYGCNGIAYHYFKSANKWCCSSSFRSCKGYGQKLSAIAKLRHKDSLLAKLRIKLENKELSCYYCGKPALFIVGGKRGCCEPTPKQCPEHAKWRSQLITDAYKKDSTRGIKMSKSLIKAQNKPEVKEKKRIAMLNLHNNDCMPCKDFQLNFKEGRIKQKETLYPQVKQRLIDKGVPEKHIPIDYKEMKQLSYYITYMLTLIKGKKKSRETLRSKSNSFKERVITKGGLSL